MSVDISIIVPVYEDWGLMDIFIEHMKEQTLCKKKWELILVDNGSSNVPDKKLLPHFVRLFVCEQPGSYSARNFGISKTGGGLLVFSDADCQPDPAWLEEYWRAHLCYGGKTLIAGAVVVDKLGDGAMNKYEKYDSFFGIPQAKYVQKSGYAVTANLAVPKMVFNQVGMFDSRRFSGGDAEFCRRAIRSGMQLKFLESARVLHPARSTWAELETKVRRVKGGQLRNGSCSRRAYYLIRTVFSPLHRAMGVMSLPISFKYKLEVLSVALRLAIVEWKEAFFLIFGSKPERR